MKLFIKIQLLKENFHLTSNNRATYWQVYIRIYCIYARDKLSKIEYLYLSKTARYDIIISITQ
jgi:hypothetical protein